MQLLPNKQEQQTIIIVEDDHGNATVLEMLLSMTTTYISFSYRSAADLLKNLEEVRQSSPALFLIDYFLPAINGLALCRRLSEMEDFKGIPIVLVSASMSTSLIKEARQSGITLLHKPYDIDALFSVIKQLA